MNMVSKQAFFDSIDAQVVHRPDFHVASPVPTGSQPRFTLFTDASFIYSFGCLDATSFIPTGSIENYYFFRDSVVGIFCSQRT